METILITTSSFGAAGSDPLSKIDRGKVNIVLNPYGRKLTEIEIKGLIEKHQPVGMIAGVEPLTLDVLRIAKRLKVISRCGVGLDSIDLGAAEGKNIIVASTPDAVTIPVAELTLTLILSLLRRIHIAESSIRAGKWERPMGNLLYKKSVGIIGLGRIGTYIARLIAPFDCQLLGFDPNVKKHELCATVDIDELLSSSDIVTLHLPYSNQNHHFISSGEMAKMKDGAFLINTARGGLIEEGALIDNLKSGKLSGAALDCFEEEPYTGNLIQFNNVLLTSHIGSYAKEARAMMEDQACENLLNELIKLGVKL